MRPINEIIVHCAATRPEWMDGQPTIAKVREIDRWHRANGWAGIGYHFVIDRDGNVAEGRPLERTGAHVQGHNTGTIGICLLGGHGSAKTDAFKDHFTAAQNKALLALIVDLRQRFPSIRTVSGHNQYAAKACPGFFVPTWLADAQSRPVISPDATTRRPTNYNALTALFRAISALFQKRKSP